MTTTERIEAAWRMVGELCEGHRTWTLRVPVQPTDPDIVISDALRDARRLLTELEWIRDHTGDGYAARIAEAAINGTERPEP